MDILAHGLWTGAAAVALRRHFPLRVRAGVMWGILPDLVAFSVLFAAILAGHALGDHPIARLAAPSDLPQWLPAGSLVLPLTTALYNVSHSVPAFLAVFAGAWSIRGQPRWEIGGWGLHILLDIPTHARSFFPTPFLWPLGSWTFDGVAWTAPWALGLNYAALAAAWLWLRHGAATNAGGIR